MIKSFFATLSFMSRLPVPARWSQGLDINMSVGLLLFHWWGYYSARLPGW